MTTTGRARRIADAREMLDWVEAHPTVPMPALELIESVGAGDRLPMAKAISVIQMIADAIEVPLRVSDGRYQVKYEVGTASWRACYHSPEVMDQYDAHMSYHGSVTPEDAS